MKKRSISIFTVLCMMAVMFPAMVSAADYSFLTFDKENGIITDCDESFSGELVIPEEIDGVPVTGIGFRAFEGCTALTGINIPDAVSVIDFGAFEGCTALENINIPDSVTYIGEQVFSYCTALIGIDMSDSITSIGRFMFSDCTALTGITIPGSVEYIDDNAFYGCDNLADVYYSGSEADWQAIDIGSDGNEPLFNAAIHYNHTNTPSISSVTAEPVAGGYSVKVELEDVTSACTVTAVLYDGGGLADVSAEAAYINTSSVDTTVEGTGGKLKVFIWDSLEGMRPLDVPYEITL